ncbi:Uncharacterised protein [Shigella sonnei]|nr:Uncharacterised protein [Shigella sonnei]CSF06088.1 Uncharacterised protein [Shigella sonnei]
MQCVGHVENHRRVTRHFLHNAEAQHIDNQVVIAEVSTAIAKNHFFVAAFFEFINDITHLSRADKLWFLDVNYRTGFRHGFNQVSLASKKRRQLNHIHDISNGLCLTWFVNVGDNFHAKSLLQLLEDFHPFFQARSTIRVDGGAVGFVKRGFEHVRDTQFLGHGYVVLANAHRQIARFQHVHTTKQYERQVICYVDVANANHFLFHRIALILSKMSIN